MATQYRNESDFLIINGVKMPCPDYGMTITSTQVVNAGRNVNAQVVGQLVGRRQWKIDNLQWTGLTADQWKRIREAFEDFYVMVTFTGDDNERHDVMMYPGDSNAKPLFLNDIFYDSFETCKFNLIDCGW